MSMTSSKEIMESHDCEATEVVPRERSRPRVLLLAFHCNPNHGSEWAVGWNRALESAKHFDTWVICQGDQQEVEIKQFLKDNGAIPGLNFEFISHSKGVGYPAHPGRLSWLTYNLWHRRAFHLAKRLHEKYNFDLTHQATNSGYREPGYLWKLDLPFVWGPVGGLHNFPWRFLPEAGFKCAVGEVVRNVLNFVQLNWSRRGRMATKRARAVFVANSTAAEALGRARGVVPRQLLETGIARVSDSPRKRGDSGTLRILWSGQLIARKALSLLLKALSQLPRDVKYELRILGNGPLEARCKRMAEELGIVDRVEWIGWLPYSQIAQQYDWADLFAFTSLRDNSGNVVLEALARGLPIVCLDHQGVRDIVTEQCGLKIKVESPQQVVNDLRDGLAALAHDDRRIDKMSEAAVARARDYLWSRLGSQMTDTYRSLLDDQQRCSLHVTPSRNSTIATPKGAIRGAMSWCALRIADGERLLTGSRPGNRCGILMYHRVCNPTPGFCAPTWNVTPARLREQLSGLIARGFQPWSLRKLVEARRAQRPVPDKVFAVTFDDGYENNLVNALPVLRELNVPATIFLATAFIDSDQPFPCDDWPAAGEAAVPAEGWRPLSTSQCRELLASGLIELGTHTHTHQDFRGRPDEFRHDLANSVDVLCDRLGVLDPLFAFPHGALSPEMIEIASEVGVSCALSTEPKLVSPDSDAFVLGRFDVGQHDSPMTLAAKLSGWYTKLSRGFRRQTIVSSNVNQSQTAGDRRPHSLSTDARNLRSSADATPQRLSHR